MVISRKGRVGVHSGTHLPMFQILNGGFVNPPYDFYVRNDGGRCNDGGGILRSLCSLKNDREIAASFSGRTRNDWK